MAVVLAVVTIPFRAVLWVFRHPRLLVLAVVVVFAVMGLRACGAAFGTSTATPTEPYQEVAPPREKAPYVLATSTRVYYVTRYSDDGHVITLHDYYTYDWKKWARQSSPLRIDRTYYGEVRLHVRTD